MALLAEPACIAQVPPIVTHDHQFTQPETESAADYVWEFLSLNAILKSCWILVNLSVNSELFHSHKVTKSRQSAAALFVQPWEEHTTETPDVLMFSK